MKANTNPFNTAARTTMPGANSSDGGMLLRKMILNIKRKPAVPKIKPVILPALFFMIIIKFGWKISLRTNVIESTLKNKVFLGKYF